MLLAMTTHHVNVDLKKMLLRAWKWSEGPNSQDKTYRILKKRGPDSINKHTEMQQERYIYFYLPFCVKVTEKNGEKLSCCSVRWVRGWAVTQTNSVHRHGLLIPVYVRSVDSDNRQKKGWKLNDSLASKRKPYTLIQKLDFDKNIKYDKEHILLTIWLFLCSSESPNPMLVMSSFSKSKSSLFESHWDCL